MSVDKTTNDITKLAATISPEFSFAGAATICAVGGKSEKTRMSALEMCSGFSNHTQNAAKAAGVVLLASAVGGFLDATSAGTAAMLAAGASFISGNDKGSPRK